MQIKFDSKIEKFLEFTKLNNIDIYLVGGYIRDFLIAKECFDLDFALVSDYDEACKKLKNRYKIEKNDYYKCIKFKIDEYEIEITHARKEREYLDYRHPFTIEFTNDIKEDCLRRDFTINALYYKDNKIYDYVNGMEDINNHKLKVIGDTPTRFKEDPLRILRMIRFSCDNFDISESDKRIILDSSYLLKELSEPSFNKEFDRILMINNLYVINEYKDLFEDYFNVKFKDLIVLNKLDKLEEKKTYLNIKNKSLLFKYKDITIIDNLIDLNLLIYKYGKEVMKILIEYHDKIHDTNLISKYNFIIENKYYDKNSLDITALEIIEIIRDKELTSYYIDKISYEIIKGNLNNTREEIKKYLLRVM